MGNCFLFLLEQYGLAPRSYKGPSCSRMTTKRTFHQRAHVTKPVINLRSEKHARGREGLLCTAEKFSCYDNSSSVVF